MDVVILRPGRDPIFASKARGGGTRDTALKDGDISTEEWDSSSDDVKAAAIEAWPSRAMAAVTQAYKGGTHIDLVYPTESSEGGRLGPASLVPEQGAGEGGREDDKGEKGEPVVEVLRCGGWEWTPTVSLSLFGKGSSFGIRSNRKLTDVEPGACPVSYSLRGWLVTHHTSRRDGACKSWEFRGKEWPVVLCTCMMLLCGELMAARRISSRSLALPRASSNSPNTNQITQI